MATILALILCISAVEASPVVTAANMTVLVTGATGRTGSAIYKRLQSQPGVMVRALVRDADKAKSVLGCKACDASEGIFIGDVTKPSTLVPAFKSIDALAIAVGVSGNVSAAVQKAVEFTGVINQVQAMAQGAAPGVSGKQKVAFCSSMGTTQPNPPPYEGGSVLFWKLQAETFLATSGIQAAVVKPCGLGTGKGHGSTLVVGHNDELFEHLFPPMIAREDVARVMSAAVMSSGSLGLRFDLCSKLGHATPDSDLQKLLDSSRWPWDQVVEMQ